MSRYRFVRPVLAGLVVVIVALAVIVWLPLDADVEADIKDALVGYETSRQVAWPASEPLVLPLSAEAEAALAASVERGHARYAAGLALGLLDADRAVARFLRIAASEQPWVVTKWAGEVVYFDFVRQTASGEVIVRAGVRRAHQVGQSRPKKGRVVARRWRWEDAVTIDEYTLRDDGKAWKVVKTSHWGTCGPEGENVVEGAYEF